ncbi:PREDICTED: ankyrin-3-like [Populus euphratica]|uniref:Ankyrin-3-like n=1 Tax=Populus euphratica TaxID=75702 RepID=A0AAJ6T8V3_POPEU|nr:PREDICTED: ankyrin-3-like [Populus euphratica]
MSSVAINIAQNSIPRDHMPNTKIDSKLYECVKKDNIEEFESRIQQRSTKQLVTPCGNSLLHVAVSYGSDNITSYLARTFPSLITIQNSQKDTILHLAAREGKASHTIKSLVELNPSLIRKKNTKGNTPLHDAVITDNKEVAKLLVSSYPEVAYYNNNNGKSPLYLAVENGNKKKILDDLLKTEVSFPIKSEDGDAVPKGKSPVHAAIKQRNRDILEKIEKEKPELLRLTEEELGNSLHYASSIGFLEGVRFLLKKFHDGAYETNLEGNYPIHLACKSQSVDIVKEFLDMFPYPKEFLNKKGQNILHVAAKYGNGNVVRYILKQDRKPDAPLLNAIDEDGNTPLHLAARYGHCMATFLLVSDNRVERFIVNNSNWTPYELAEEFSERTEEIYIKTDEMRAKERRQFDSKNTTPAPEIKVFTFMIMIRVAWFLFWLITYMYEVEVQNLAYVQGMISKAERLRLEVKEKREREMRNQIINKAEEYIRALYEKRQQNCETNKAQNREREGKIYVKHMDVLSVVHSGPKANTNKTQTTDLRGSPKSGTSMEAADCILLEE